MPRMLPVLLGGDANVYGMARSFYECYGVRSLAVCRRALPALAHSRLVRVHSPRFRMYQQINLLFHDKQSYFYLILDSVNPNLFFLFQNVFFHQSNLLFDNCCDTVATFPF